MNSVISYGEEFPNNNGVVMLVNTLDPERYMFRGMLESTGFEIHTAQSIDDAIEQLSHAYDDSIHYELAVVDRNALRTGRAKGSEIVFVDEMLKKGMYLDVIITGSQNISGGQSVIDAMEKQNAAGYVIKSDQEKLVEKVASYLSKKRNAPERHTDSVLARLDLLIHERIPFILGHIEHMIHDVEYLIDELGLRDDLKRDIKIALKLHDIGKLATPIYIQNKRGKLTPEENRIVKDHPRVGANILYLAGCIKAAKIVESHHEYCDGSGHPRGLKKDQICIGARIIGLVDAFHGAMQDRPYKKALTAYESFKQMLSQKERYDPNLWDKYEPLIDFYLSTSQR